MAPLQTIVDIRNQAERLYRQQINWRRWLHQHPELSNQEFKTTAFIKRTLGKQGLKFQSLGKMKTGAVAIINSGKNYAVAVRSDIDALPIYETTNVPFKSLNEGMMHACGHDIHAAILMGTAIILHKNRNNLPGCVKFLFQPAEEMPPGGAQALIKEGVLRNPSVNMIFGLHTDPNIDVGKIGLRDGPMMASVTDFDITVIGKGGHAARPNLAVDAIVTASEIVESLQKIVSREIDPLKPVVMTFGTIRGGTARNIIAAETLLRGTARTLHPDNLKFIAPLIKRTVDGICRARGAKYKIDFVAQYPVLVNHKAANGLYKQVFGGLFGADSIVEASQTMGGEDFAFYLQKVRGAFCRLGIRNNKIGANKPWHTPDFMVDERSIFYGTVLLTSAILKYFEGKIE